MDAFTSVLVRIGEVSWEDKPAILLSAILPGFTAIYFTNYNLFNSTDILKLLLLSVLFSIPQYIISKFYGTFSWVFRKDHKQYRESEYDVESIIANTAYTISLTSVFSNIFTLFLLEHLHDLSLSEFLLFSLIPLNILGICRVILHNKLGFFAVENYKLKEKTSK